MKRLLTVLLLVLAATLAFAQTETARVTGRVTDQTGAVVIGAECKITNIDTNISVATTTNDEGIYVLPGLKPGTYRLTIAKQGFGTVVKPNMELHVQDAINENFSLAVGSASESVTVSEGAQLVNTQSATVSTVVDRQFVQNMPLNGRSFQSLIAMTPGIVFVAASQTDQGQFSVNGQRTNTNYFMVDGVGANFGVSANSYIGNTWSGSSPAWTISGGTNGLVSVDAMQEFRIQTSTFAPEFGRTPGGQISIVTKSGSNSFHGNAFDYLRNDVFDARNWFNKVPARKPPLRQNDFGGTLGGPIWKDHTFFFFSFEGLRLRQPQTVVETFLTAAARTNVAAVWKPWVNAFPIPDGPVNADGLTAPLTLSGSPPTTLNATSLRLDHNLTSRISLFARYNHSPSSTITGLDHVRFNISESTDTATAGATFAMSANKANDFRANWSRQTGANSISTVSTYGGVAPSPSALYPPGLSPADTQLYYYGALHAPRFSAGARFGTYSDNGQNQLNLVDTLSWTTGKHSLKFGVDWRRLRPRTQFSPHTVAFYADYSNLLAGTVYMWQFSSTSSPTLGINNYSAFAQDTFRMSDKLTLTYGLRWDINPPPASVTSVPIYHLSGIFDSNPLALTGAGPLWKTQYSNVAPRIGAAYQLTPKTVLRAGFGVFADLGAPNNVALSAGIGFPYNRTNTAAAALLNQPFNLSDPALVQQLPAFTLTPTSGTASFTMAVDPNMGLPRTLQWNVAVERELGKNQSLTVSYVAANGKDLIRTDSIFHPASVTPFSSAYAIHNAGWSNYKSLQVDFQRRMSHGLQALVSYTFSKSTDTASNDASGFTLSSIQQANAAVPLNYGYSDFDVRHNFSGGFSYEVPSPVATGFGHSLLNGWALDGIVRGRSGLPFNVTAPTQVSINGVPNSLRANVVPGQPFWISDPTAPGGKKLNIAAFSDIVNNQPGNLVRNSLRSFGMNQTDLALRRRFNLGERVKLDVRAEYFNLFNHPMFATPPTGMYSPSTFGISTNTINVSTGSPGGGGLNPQYNAGGPRSGQLTLKLMF